MPVIRRSPELVHGLRNVILKTSDAATLKREAVKQGMLTLRQDGWSCQSGGAASFDIAGNSGAVVTRTHRLPSCQWAQLRPFCLEA